MWLRVSAAMQSRLWPAPLSPHATVHTIDVRQGSHVANHGARLPPPCAVPCCSEGEKLIPPEKAHTHTPSAHLLGKLLHYTRSRERGSDPPT
jgi:hypothetical protein